MAEQACKTKAKTLVSCECRQIKSGKNKTKEQNKKILINEKGYLEATFDTPVKKRMSDSSTTLGNQDAIRRGVDETNKRKLQIVEEAGNKKSKMPLNETNKKEGIRNANSENKDEKKKNASLLVDVQGSGKDDEKPKVLEEKSSRTDIETAEKKKKELNSEKKKNAEKSEGSEHSEMNGKEKSLEEANESVFVTDTRRDEEKETCDGLVEASAIVSLKNVLSEEKQMKEDRQQQQKSYESSKNEEQEKYKKALQYNEMEHKYPRIHFVSFSNKYKDVSIRLSDDQLTCYGDKGWASVFLNCGADDGKWYFEITVENSVVDLNFLGYNEKKIKINSGVRVGYACRYMRYDHPLGTNKYSYCVNSKDGRMFNSSISYDCMDAFSKGDVIGCYMNLKKQTNYNFDPRLDKKLYEYIQNGILCDPQNPPELTKSEGSLIFFSLNGEIQENAFIDIYDGFYHPSVSLYMGASARINLGPNFKYNYLKDYLPCMYMHPPIVS